MAVSATLKGHGYQVTIGFDDAVGMSLAETYSTIGEAITAAALKLLDMPEHLAPMDDSDLAG